MTTTGSNTIILGAGVIGTATAYYLSLSPDTPAQSIHLVETTPELFSSASGYAGGFLAKDCALWTRHRTMPVMYADHLQGFSPSLAELGALSFDLHRQLAEEHGGREKWAWSWTQGTSIADLGSGSNDATDWMRHGGSRAELRAQHVFGKGKGPAWPTTRQGQRVEIISDDETTAQVEPLKLCQFLLNAARSRGVQLHHPARALSVSQDMRGELAAVRIAHADGEEVDVPCTRLIITAGAWTPQVFTALFPKAQIHIPVSQLGGHSVVVRSPRWGSDHEALGCHAVFATDQSGFSPEIFSRVGGEIYMAGLNDSSLPLPKSAAEAKPDPCEIKKLKAVVQQMLDLPDGSDDVEIIREGLCFRPITSKNQPIVSRVPDEQLGGITTRGGGDGGVFVAAGHGPWGISQSLGTGKVLAELIEGQTTSADVSGLTL